VARRRGSTANFSHSSHVGSGGSRQSRRRRIGTRIRELGTVTRFPSDVKARHDRMVGLAERILKLYKDLPKTSHESEALERQIAATDRQLDILVHELYGLAEEGVSVVEGSAE
jgi:hypothetical protein